MTDTDISVIEVTTAHAIFDTLYPDSGQQTRYAVPIWLWGSLQHSAACRGSLVSAWCHLRERWKVKGWVTLRVLVKGRSLVGEDAL